MPHQTLLTFTTRPRATLDITADVAAAVRAAGLRCGLAHVFVQHTSCSLLITENADPDVRRASGRTGPAQPAPGQWRHRGCAG